MAWTTSTRRDDLPSNWPSIRRRILKRDLGQCRLRIAIDCDPGNATEVDHIGDRRDHRDEMLRSVCSPCHRLRTGRQATEARVARRRRPTEPPPGRL